jgi:beta-lactamase class A
MNRIGLAVILTLALFPSSAAADVGSARQYAQERAGIVSFAYQDERGRLHGYQPDLRYRSASLVKAMILVAYLRRVSWGGLPLDAAARARLGPMITRSDNIDANWAYDRIGRGPTLDALARRAGMTSFAAASYWAYSQTSARDQVAFFARLERLTPPAYRGYAIGLFRQIVPSQHWGIRRAARGWRITFKGGWFESRHLWHQVAILERGKTRLVLAVLTDRSPSDAYGQATIEGVARRVLSRSQRSAVPSNPWNSSSEGHTSPDSASTSLRRPAATDG